ncbi:hypothetical protein [Polyangium mundeleinium]|uniref:Lipoprotein n=1 Tax=Polyangium mundeleinium TaxID=2995306 RepID=A0ABT5EG02_9BACT|nr:hypothetical protein [Polyangium mundeleinium]MDC0740753.1 hypothetical protein [Polyangium mundeleinium]
MKRIFVGALFSFAALVACGSAPSSREKLDETQRQWPTSTRKNGPASLEAPTSAPPSPAPSTSAAQQGPAVGSPPPLFASRLRFDAAKRVEIDGKLDEWRDLVSGVSAVPDAPDTFAATLGADDAALYIAARIRPARDGSATVKLRLRFLDRGTSSAPWEVSVAARSGAVTVRAPGGPPPTAVSDASARFQISGDETTLEARIPWTALAPAARSRVGIRAALVYERDGHERAVIGMGDAEEDLCPMPFEQVLLARLDPIAQRLWPHATRSWFQAGADYPIAVDVTGDSKLERVGKLGNQITVCEPKNTVDAHCETRTFPGETRVEGAGAQRITRDDKDDLVLHYWRTRDTAEHLVMEVVPVVSGAPLVPIFEHEVSVYLCCGSEANAPPHIRDAVAISPRTIEISAERPWRLSESKFTEAPLGGTIRPVVTPWEKPPKRRYVFVNGAFEPKR